MRNFWGHYGSWHVLKSRFENAALNSILFGAFTALTSTFFYRYSIFQSNSAKAQLIIMDALLFSVMLFLLAAVLRYLAQFIFLHFCPNIVQIHRDMDDLLKKSKDTIIDESDWPDLSIRQIEVWNKQNYCLPPIRIYIALNELLVFLVFAGGVFYFARAVWPLLVQIVPAL